MRQLLFALFFAYVLWPVPGSAGQRFKKEDLLGVWEYVSAYTQLADGTKVDQFGPDPCGLFVLLPNGSYSHIVMAGELPRVESGLIKQMTDEEARAIAGGVLAHYGTFTVDEDRGTFTVEIDHASFPNFDGVKQVREVLELTPTLLRYVNGTSSAGPGARVFAVLRRR